MQLQPGNHISFDPFSADQTCLNPWTNPLTPYLNQAPLPQKELVKFFKPERQQLKAIHQLLQDTYPIVAAAQHVTNSTKQSKRHFETLEELYQRIQNAKSALQQIQSRGKNSAMVNVLQTETLKAERVLYAIVKTQEMKQISQSLQKKID